MPFEDAGACPFEGCRYQNWTANAAVAVKTERWIGAPILYRLRKGDRANALTGVVVTHRAGRVRFRKTADLPSPTGALHVEPNDTLYVLSIRQDERVTTAWFKGHVYRDLDGSTFFNPACAQTPDACPGTIVDRPLTAWWVQVRNAKGAVGWTNQPERFDNKGVRAR